MVKCQHCGEWYHFYCVGYDGATQFVCDKRECTEEAHREMVLGTTKNSYNTTLPLIYKPHVLASDTSSDANVNPEDITKQHSDTNKPSFVLKETQSDLTKMVSTDSEEGDLLCNYIPRKDNFIKRKKIFKC